MTQLNRDDWLKTGLDILEERGIDALTIDVLCRQLAVTKGSFYHHFKNRAVYLTSLLEYWEDEYTSRFIEYSQQGESAEDQLERLNHMVLKNFGGYERHIRAWAQVDPLARGFQERVDQRRIECLYQLHEQWMQDETQARTMAHLTYTTLIGSTSIIPALGREDFEAMMALVTRMSSTLIKKDQK